MKKTTMLKQLILDSEILVMPAAYDVLSAKIIEKLEFKAIQCSGFGIAASYLGLPDVAVLTMSQMLEITRNICSAVNVPVMADGDTGFGNAVNTYYTVKQFEEAGAAGINLEDQVFPKRCGHMSGKQIISIDEMVMKIRAATLARKDPDFVINARTDAIAINGVEEAVRRGNAYAEAGATMIFVEAPQSIDQIKYVIKSINAPVSINMLQGGRTPVVTIKQLEEWGAARVSIPVSPVFIAAKSLHDGLKKIKECGDIRVVNDSVFSFEEFTALVDLPFIRSLENQLLTDCEIEARYGTRQELESKIKQA